ncbi:MAG: hypothetical protein IJT94_12725 [Oscillibacter sp.]|nr:hypothetical protein [Oscillibacter sp.]
MAAQTISLSLPEQVCMKLWRKATAEGMTVDKLLSLFVHDLVHDSLLDRDNPGYVDTWLDQCKPFFWTEAHRFSVWAAQNGELYGDGGALFYVGELDDVAADLADLEADPVYTGDPDLVRDAMDFREAIADYRRSLKWLYDKYVEDWERRRASQWVKDPPAQTFEEALDDLREHQRQMEAYKSGRLPDKAADAPGKEAAAV